MAITSVIFDLDGVLLDSEPIWNRARMDVTTENGGQWRDQASQAMMGMSSPEWSRYMHETLGVQLAPEEISETVVARLQDLYAKQLPLLPGARETVRAVADVWPLGLASSANRPIIELVLDLSELRGAFAVTVSSEEVPRGKPAPDVYLEAARRLGAEPTGCVAVEDSANGLRSAAAAGMVVIAVPNRDFPPEDDALGLADAVLESLAELTASRIEQAAEPRG